MLRAIDTAAASTEWLKTRTDSRVVARVTAKMVFTLYQLVVSCLFLLLGCEAFAPVASRGVALAATGAARTVSLAASRVTGHMAGCSCSACVAMACAAAGCPGCPACMCPPGCPGCERCGGGAPKPCPGCGNVQCACDAPLR